MNAMPLVSTSRLLSIAAALLVPIWRAKVDTNSGAYKVQIENRLELFAERLVGRLVRDRLLPHRMVQ